MCEYWVSVVGGEWDLWDLWDLWEIEAEPSHRRADT